MTTLYFQCKNPLCGWVDQLIVIEVPDIAPGVIDIPNIQCACTQVPYRLRVRNFAHGHFHIPMSNKSTEGP